MKLFPLRLVGATTEFLLALRKIRYFIRFFFLKRFLEFLLAFLL